MRVVVVGAGPAGVRVAHGAAGQGLDVALLGAEPGTPYNRVALSNLLAGDVDEAGLMTPAAAGVDYRPGTRVAALDRGNRRVVLEGGGALAYDRLVLATGSRAVRLPLPGADLPGVLLYRTLADVRAMLDAAEAGGRAVVIGGGLLGLEAAAGLARRGMAVTVVHAVDRLMERQLDGGGAARLARRLAGQGVSLALAASTRAIAGTGRAEGVELADGRVLPADLIVMAVGIRPDTSLAQAAGLAVGRGVIVDDAVQTSDGAILAVGECAEHRGVCCGLAAPALAQADVAVATLLGQSAAYNPAEDPTALKVAGAAVWSAGEPVAADADSLTLDDEDLGCYRHLLLRGGRLVGAVLLGETGDAPWYLSLIRGGTDVSAMRHALPFGPGLAGTAP